MNKRALLLLVVLMIVGGLFPSRFVPAVKAQGTTTKIVLATAGTITVSIYNVVTNTCNGEAWLEKPGPRRLLFSDYNNKRGQTVSLGTFPAGTELLFSIIPGYVSADPPLCAKKQDGTPFTYIYYSDGTSNDTSPAYWSHAIVSSLRAEDSWRIDFEDLPSWYVSSDDFNDLSLIVRQEGAQTDFRQDDPSWKNMTYDHTGATIGAVGCALTSAANVANFQGAAPVDPFSLNDCLARPDVSGYVRTEDDPNCTNGNTAACMAGAIHWTRLTTCLDPFDPANSPQLMRFNGKYTLGALVIDPFKGAPVRADKPLLKKIIDQDLSNKNPVILEVQSPNNAGGLHYLVANQKDGATYDVLDPLCGDWPTCATSKKTLADYGDALLGVIRYAPGDGKFHPSLLIDGFAPLGGFMVIDPLGRTTGYSSQSSSTFVNIPNSGFYFQPPVSNESSGATLGTGMNELYIIDPIPGNYYIYVTGANNGAYAISIQYQTGLLTTAITRQSGGVGPDGWLRLKLPIAQDGSGGTIVTTPVPNIFYAPLLVGNGWQMNIPRPRK